MTELFLLCVLLLIADIPPAALQGMTSTTISYANKLVSFSPFNSFSPKNISCSPLIRCCDNFAAAIDHNTSICSIKLISFFPCISSSPNNIIPSASSIQCCDNIAAIIDDNTAICLYCFVHNGPILGFLINSTKLMSFSECISSTPNNISGSPPIQCCDNFVAVFDDNNSIYLYGLVDNPPVLGFPIYSTKLMSLASVNPVKEKEGEESSSLESLFSGLSLSPRLTKLSLTLGPGPRIPRTGYHDNPAPQELLSSLTPSSDADDKPFVAAQATQSASSSTTSIMCDYFCQWLLYAALVCHYVKRRDDQPEMPHLEEDDHPQMPHLEEDNIDDVVDEIPREIPIYRLIENVDTLVATVDITGCFGFTSFSTAVKLSNPVVNDWDECVLWPWRGERMVYIAENAQVLNPLERSWIQFSQHLNFIRVSEQNEEPTIGLVLREVGAEDELTFDVLMPRRYIINSRSFAVAVHYTWSAWSSIEPLELDQLEEANIAFQAHIHYFDMNNLAIFPPPLLAPPDNLERWDQFITALSYITIVHL